MSVPVDTSGAQLSAFSRLESLPGELLEIVFDSLEDANPSGFSHPISRTLRPYVTREQYRFIKIDSSHFFLLCRTIADSPHLASLIKNFMLVPTRSGSPQDFQIQHESLVFNFFKLVSLESLDSLEHHPLLQKRVVSAKYAIHCNKSLKSLSLYFPSSHYGEDDQLCRQSRYLSHIRSLNSLRLIMGDSEEGDFDERSKDHFEEEDRLELERNGLYISYFNTIADVKIDGEYNSDDLADFAARCRGVTELTLAMSDQVQFDTNVGSVLGAINPLLLRRLSIGTPNWMDDEDSEIDLAGLTPFINLVTLRLPRLNFNAELITLLPNFPKLTEIGSYPPWGGCPTTSDILPLLDPLTRPPALRTFDFDPSIDVISNGQCIGIDYHTADRGLALPIWGSEWTVDGAREIVELGDQQGLELVGRERWEKAIAMTADYLAAGGILSDSEAEDG